MALIQIKSGTYAYRPDGKKLIPVTRDSDPIEVSGSEAVRLTGLDVADYVMSEANVAELYNDSEPNYNANMKAAELQAIMDANGLEYKAGMTKAEMVAALDDYFDDTDDSNDPPVFEPEEPSI